MPSGIMRRASRCSSDTTTRCVTVVARRAATDTGMRKDMGGKRAMIQELGGKERASPALRGVGGRQSGEGMKGPSRLQHFFANNHDQDFVSREGPPGFGSTLFWFLMVA